MADKLTVERRTENMAVVFGLSGPFAVSARSVAPNEALYLNFSGLPSTCRISSTELSALPLLAGKAPE